MALFDLAMMALPFVVKTKSLLAPHVHNKIDWNKIKDDEIHLDPSDLPDLSIPAFDWLREYHRDEL